MKFVYGILATLVAAFSMFVYYIIKEYVNSELELTNFVFSKATKLFVTDLYPKSIDLNDVISTQKYMYELTQTDPRSSLTSSNVTVMNITRETDDHLSNITIKIFCPKKLNKAMTLDGTKSLDKLPVILWFHGGGFVVRGGLDTDSNVLSKLTGFIIVSPYYRLAPQHPYPAALEDAAMTLKWIKAKIHLFSGDPNNIIIGGNSAGGNLASALAASLYDNKFSLVAKPRVYQLGHIKIKGLFVVSPMLQYDVIRPSWFTYSEVNRLVSLEQILWFWNLYTSSRSSGMCHNDYRLCPINAPKYILKSFPKTSILLAKHDVLLDEGLAFYDLLRRYNVDVNLKVFNDSIHGFWPTGADNTESYKQASAHMLTQLMRMADFEAVPTGGLLTLVNGTEAVQQKQLEGGETR